MEFFSLIQAFKVLKMIFSVSLPLSEQNQPNADPVLESLLLGVAQHLPDQIL